MTLPGGNSIGQTFGDAGQLLSTILRHGSTVVDSYSYGYDNVGQLTGAVGTESGGLLRGNENLGCLYDPAGKLLDEIKMDPLFLVSF